MGAFISYMFSNTLGMEGGYLLGVSLSLILWGTLGCSHDLFKNLGKNGRSMLSGLAILFALVGGSLWFIGEVLEYTGKDAHPLVAPLGAFTCAISALMSLIQYSNK